MPTRALAFLLPLAALAAPALLPAPAAAEDPAKGELFERQLANNCRPPLKYAAGACTPVCPAGYEDEGRFCRYREPSNGGGGPGL